MFKAILLKVLIAILVSGMSLSCFSCDDLFQSKLIANIHKYEASGSSGASFSPLRSPELESLSPISSQGEVISFGSGPDIGRPLVSFSNAKKIHLVDSFLGWGKNPKVVLDEIFIRMRSYFPGGTINVKSKGFLTKFSNSELKDSNDFYKKMFSQREQKTIDPIEVTITSQAGISKSVIIHCANYNNEIHMKGVFNYVRNLEGVLVSGAPIPELPILNNITKKLENGGVIIAEFFKAIDATQFEQNHLLDRLESQMEMKVIAKQNSEFLEIMEESFKRTFRTIVFTK